MIRLDTFGGCLAIFCIITLVIFGGTYITVCISNGVCP